MNKLILGAAVLGGAVAVTAALAVRTQGFTCCPFRGPDETLTAPQGNLALAEEKTPADKSAAGDEKPAEKAAEKTGDKKPDPSIGGDPAANAAATGKITGEILLKGKAPKMAPHQVKEDHRDRKYCGHEIQSERLIVSDKSQIAGAVVSLNMKPGKPKPREIELANEKCRFVPHVQAATVGSMLKVTNLDEGILHNAHANLANEFNVAVSKGGKPYEKKLTRPGWMVMTCDIHGWMQAHIQVFQHDFFAVTGPDGKFRLEGVPPGEYELAVWQEACDVEKVTLPKIQVEAGKTAEVKLEIPPYEE